MTDKQCNRPCKLPGMVYRLELIWGVSFFKGKTAQSKNIAFQQCADKHTAIVYTYYMHKSDLYKDLKFACYVQCGF